MHTPDVISILDFALRCHGLNQRLPDVKQYPIPVIHTLQAVCQAMLYEELNPYEKNGILHIRNASDYSYDQDRPVWGRPELTHGDFWERVALSARGAIDFKLLAEYYLAEHEVAEWYLKEGMPLPDFWFTPARAKEYTERYLRENPKEEADKPAPPQRPEQIDRVICQAVARTLWEFEPNMTIAAVCEHKAVRQFANGAHYKLPTLRKWVGEVAPEHIKGRRGRPKKTDE